MVSTPKANGFADHYPYEKWLFHWEYTLFSDKPIWIYHYPPVNVNSSRTGKSPSLSSVNQRTNKWAMASIAILA